MTSGLTSTAYPGANPGRGSLTSEPDRFSEAAWDLLLASQDQARRWRHGQLDVEHLMQVLFSDPGYGAWIDPLPLQPERLLDRLDAFCADQPGGSGAQLFIGDALEELLEAACSQQARLVTVCWMCPTCCWPCSMSPAAAPPCWPPKA